MFSCCFCLFNRNMLYTHTCAYDMYIIVIVGFHMHSFLICDDNYTHTSTLAKKKKTNKLIMNDFDKKDYHGNVFFYNKKICVKLLLQSRLLFSY